MEALRPAELGITHSSSRANQASRCMSSSSEDAAADGLSPRGIDPRPDIRVWTRRRRCNSYLPSLSFAVVSTTHAIVASILYVRHSPKVSLNSPRLTICAPISFEGILGPGAPSSSPSSPAYPGRPKFPARTSLGDIAISLWTYI